MEFCRRLFYNFTERCNLIPHLGNSDLLVHKNYKSTFCIVILLTLSFIYPFDVFYVLLFIG